MREKILIAISDNTLSNLLVKELKQDDYDVSAVSNGKDALNTMRSLKPDLLLIDLVLPEISGYDVLHEKSYDKLITKIPIIIVSNSGMPIDMKRMLSTPIVKEYIIKAHIEPEEVIKEIRDFFNKNYISSKNIKMENKAKGKKVLWVEDDKLLSTILSRKFESSGFILMKANNGDEAFSLLSKDIPDIIILDVLLPGINGFDVLQKIKADERLRKIPVIMLSNMSKQSDIEKGKSLGAQKFIVKAAASLDEIIKEVEKLLI